MRSACSRRKKSTTSQVLVDMLLLVMGTHKATELRLAPGEEVDVSGCHGPYSYEC